MIPNERNYPCKFLSLVIHVFLIFNFTLAKKKDLEQEGLLVDTTNCKIPNLYPFDKSILKFYKNRPGPLSCGTRPFYFNVENGSVVMPNGIDASNLICTYREIVSDNNDFWKFKDAVEFTLGSRIPKDYVKIECSDTSSRNVIEEYVALVPDKPSPPKNSYINVIIVGIDSMSALNFQRHFPRSLNYLTDDLKAKVLNGYHKVGSDTFSNLIPFLTGHPSEDYWNVKNDSKVYFDDADLIWKHFKNEGYKTLYLDDMTTYGTFNWNKKRGFKKKPVDHYFRPMAMPLQSSQMASNNCLKSKMEIEFYWDYLKRFSLHSQRPFFAFTFVSRLLHDNHNNAGYLDVPLYNLMKDLSDSGVLNQSMLIVFSDHGFQIGGFRETRFGYYEERLPIAFLSIPQWFLKFYQCGNKHINENKNRLTTHYDMHATLLHILRMQTSKKKYLGKTKYGTSLFIQLPQSRTCEEAGVPQHWCACTPLENIVPSENRVKAASEKTINALNEQLKNTGCSKLHSQRVFHSYKSTANNGTHIVMRTQPGGAIVEATILKGNVLRPISRLDSYGKGKNCLGEADARFPYCDCP